jgi:alpha-tubulin suppressor-like RCC1 family protein
MLPSHTAPASYSHQPLSRDIHTHAHGPYHIHHDPTILRTASHFADSGQLGLGDTNDRLVPTLVGSEEVFEGSKVRTVACGHVHTLAVTEAGELWAWGYGAQARLGLNDGQDRLVPTRVDPQHFAHALISAVAAGHFHSAAVTADGALYTWGQGEAGHSPGSQVPGGLATPTLQTGSCQRWCRGSCWAGRARGGATGCARSPRWPSPWGRTSGWAQAPRRPGERDGRGGRRARHRRRGERRRDART